MSLSSGGHRERYLHTSDAGGGNLRLREGRPRARQSRLCLVSPRLERVSPGLMTGLAGMGYALLRLAEPAHVPSVLMLAPPPHHT